MGYYILVRKKIKTTIHVLKINLRQKNNNSMKIVQKTRKFFFDQILSQIQNTPKKVKTFLNVFSFYSKENPRIFEILQKIKNNPEIFRTRYGLLESIIIELKNQKTVLVFLKILLNLLWFSFWIKYFDSELSEKTKKKIKEKIKS